MVSIAVERCHDCGNSYKGKTLGLLYIFRGLACYQHSATWWHTGRCAEAGAEGLYILTHRQQEVV